MMERRKKLVTLRLIIRQAVHLKGPRPGWTEYFDSDRRVMYYHNDQSGVTQWNFPIGPVFPAASLYACSKASARFERDKPLCPLFENSR